MVQPVSRAEELERSNSSVFAERQEELDAMADKMPKRIVGQFPYLMEKNTGVIHPYTDAMAERSDLVIGCYNLEGSRNPDDADPYYNPQAVIMRGERARRVESVGPRNAAEEKAAVAEEVGRIRREERARAEAELEERLAAERDRMRQELLAELQASPAPDGVSTTEVEAAVKKGSGKGGGGKRGAAVKEKQAAPVVAGLPIAPESPEVVESPEHTMAGPDGDIQVTTADDDPDLNAAFLAAME